VIGREVSVVKRRSRPCRSCVAALATRRKTGGRMVWVIRALIISGVTAVAIGRKACVVVVYVAACAENGRVRAG